MIKEPIVFELAYKTWCINEFGMDNQYLLEGDQLALLIDTGTGVFDLKGLVSKLTDKPVLVVLTHGHVDHAGGMGQFDKVYLHAADEKMALGITREQRINYLNIMMSMCPNTYDLNENCVVEYEKQPVIGYLKDGNTIHLGNRDVYVYSTPGHTDGGLTFLDTTQRIIFSGDACNPNILLNVNHSEKAIISNVLESAQTIQALEEHYDRHYNGHVGYANSLTMNSLPQSLVQDTIDLCHALLDGSVQGSETENPFGGKCLIARNKTMQIQYLPEQIK